MSIYFGGTVKKSQAILFDFDDTLVSRANAIQIVLSAWLSKHHSNLLESQRNDALANLIKLDEQGYSDRDNFTHQLLDLYPPSDGEHYSWDYFLDQLITNMKATDSTRSMLGVLKQQYKLALITNGPRKTQMRKLKHTSLDSEFMVCLFGDEFCKPDLRMFQKAASLLDVSNKECLVVGNDPLADIAGARQAGMLTCWISHGKEWRCPPTKPSVQPDIILERVELLHDILEHIQ